MSNPIEFQIDYRRTYEKKEDIERTANDERKTTNGKQRTNERGNDAWTNNPSIHASIHASIHLPIRPYVAVVMCKRTHPFILDSTYLSSVTDIQLRFA